MLQAEQYYKQQTSVVCSQSQWTLKQGVAYKAHCEVSPLYVTVNHMLRSCEHNTHLRIYNTVHEIHTYVHIQEVTCTVYIKAELYVYFVLHIHVHTHTCTMYMDAPSYPLVKQKVLPIFLL